MEIKESLRRFQAGVWLCLFLFVSAASLAYPLENVLPAKVPINFPEAVALLGLLQIYSSRKAKRNVHESA